MINNLTKKENLNINNLISPREKSLGKVLLILGLLAWLVIIIGTLGLVFIYLIIGFIGYLFVQSAFIAHIKGNGVKLSNTQYPELYQQLLSCCQKLEMDEPEAYVINGSGVLNAFATEFLRSKFVIIHSEVVDAMDGSQDGISFYLGHELGHIRMKHISNRWIRSPVLWLPLIGAAYSRAKETTCDRHGLFCSSSSDSAARALAVLAIGPKKWNNLNLEAYMEQSKLSGGFWMSFHELLSGYPWLSRRVAHIFNIDQRLPKRSFFAYLFALLIPYSGRLGPLFSTAVVIMFVLGVSYLITISVMYY